MNKIKLLTVLFSVCLSFPAFAGNIYLTGHDIFDHDGQEGYWRIVVDYLRDAGHPSEIAEADYDIAVLCPVPCEDDMILPSDMTTPGPWTGPETIHDPEFLDDAGWAEVFSKDLIIVVESSKIGDAGRTAMNARSAQLAAFFDAGGDLFMNTNNGDSDYYTVLPPSVLATGSAIDTDTGFSATAAGVALGLTDAMMNGHQSHNIFTSVSSSLTVFELFQGSDVMSVGARNVTFAGLVAAPVPVLSAGWIVLLLLLISILGFRAMRSRVHQGTPVA